MENAKDLTNGNVLKLIITFYIPLFFTNLLQQIYTFADTAIVGKGLGDNALAAVGNMGTLTFFIIGFSIGLGNGFSVIVAQNFGAKDYEKMKRAYASSILLCLIIGSILTVFSLLMLKKTLIMLNTDEWILADSLTYGYFIFGGLLTALAYNCSAAFLRALGDSKTPLVAIITSSAVNIALDSFLILVLHTGVEGAAIATIVAQMISASICIFKLSRMEILHLKPMHWINKPKMYWELLKNGIPMAAMNSITAVGCMVVQYFINDFGWVYTAAYSACMRYTNMFMQPAFTAGHAMSAFTSQNYGAKKYGRIKEGLAVCVSIAVISYILLGSLMYFAARPLASVLLSGEASIKLAIDFFHICGITILSVDLLFVFRSAVQGMGYPLIPMLSGVVEMIMRVGVIVFLSSIVGFVSGAYAETMAWTGALVMNAIAFVIIYRKKLREVKKEAAIETE